MLNCYICTFVIDNFTFSPILIFFQIAHAVGKHNTVGINIVSLCVNNILDIRAKLLFFIPL